MSDRQLKWDLRYLRIANEVASWSKDPSTKVGAVLVRPNNTIASTGFNGFPPGHNDDPELYADREYKYKHIVHAEINALNFHPETCDGFTLYTSFPCCENCVKAMVEAGVSRIVTAPLNRNNKPQEWFEEWLQRLSLAAVIADKEGVPWDVVDV